MPIISTIIEDSQQLEFYLFDRVIELKDTYGEGWMSTKFGEFVGFLSTDFWNNEMTSIW